MKETRASCVPQWRPMSLVNMLFATSCASRIYMQNGSLPAPCARVRSSQRRASRVARASNYRRCSGEQVLPFAACIRGCAILFIKMGTLLADYEVLCGGGARRFRFVHSQKR